MALMILDKGLTISNVDILLEFNKLINNTIKGGVMWHKTQKLDYFTQIQKSILNFTNTTLVNKGLSFYTNFLNVIILNDSRNWIIHGNKISNLDNTSQTAVFLKLLAYAPVYMKSDIIKKTTRMLRLELSNYETMINISPSKRLKMSIRQDNSLYLDYSEIKVSVLRTNVKLHLCFNPELVFNEKIVDAYKIYVKCLHDKKSELDKLIYSSKILIMQLTSTCKHNKQRVICKKYVDYNRNTAHIVVYLKGRTTQEQMDNISKIATIFRNYFKENWKKSKNRNIPLYGKTFLDYNNILDGYSPENKYFLQIATSGSGDKKAICREKIIENSQKYNYAFHNLLKEYSNKYTDNPIVAYGGGPKELRGMAALAAKAAARSPGAKKTKAEIHVERDSRQTAYMRIAAAFDDEMEPDEVSGAGKTVPVRSGEHGAGEKTAKETKTEKAPVVNTKKPPQSDWRISRTNDVDRRVYYFNIKTKESVWELPVVIDWDIKLLKKARDILSKYELTMRLWWDSNDKNIKDIKKRCVTIEKA